MNKDEILHLISHRLASFINQPNRDAVKEALIRELSDILDRATGNNRGLEQTELSGVSSWGTGTTYSGPMVATPTDSGYQLHSLGQTLITDEPTSVPNHQEGATLTSGLGQLNVSSN